MKVLVIFDFDGTITYGDSFKEFLKFTHSGITYGFKALTSLPDIFMYWTGMINEKQLKERVLAIFYKGMSRESLLETGYRFIMHFLEAGKIRNDMISLIKKYQDEHASIVVVSASPDVWIEPFCDIHGIDFICTRLEYGDQGEFTGLILGENCKGENKRKAIIRKFQITDFNRVIVYGDSVGDNEMMELATERHWIS